MTRTKAAGLSAAFLVSGFALSVGLTGVAGALLWPDGPPSLNAAALLQTAAFLSAFGLATWVFGVRLGGLDSTSLRWKGRPRDALRGTGLGLVSAALAMALAVPVAGAAWLRDGGTPGAWAGTLPGLAALLVPAAFAEELVFRGVPMVLLAAAFGRRRAIVVLAVLFATAHLFNPDVTLLALANVTLAGVWLGTVFFLPGGIWTATGAHVGWNLTLAALAAPVSGLPFQVPWLDYRPGSPVWLSGGPFGPEGGVLGTVILTLATIVAARFTERPKESYA